MIAVNRRNVLHFLTLEPGGQFECAKTQKVALTFFALVGCTGCRTDFRLLRTPVLAVTVDEQIENRQNVPAVLDHAPEDVAQRRLAFGFAMPFR